MIVQRDKMHENMTKVTTARFFCTAAASCYEQRPTDGSACIMQDTSAQGYKMEGVTDGINEDLVWHREVERESCDVEGVSRGTADMLHVEGIVLCVGQ